MLVLVLGVQRSWTWRELARSQRIGMELERLMERTRTASCLGKGPVVMERDKCRICGKIKVFAGLEHSKHGNLLSWAGADWSVRWTGGVWWRSWSSVRWSGCWCVWGCGSWVWWGAISSSEVVVVLHLSHGKADKRGDDHEELHVSFGFLLLSSPCWEQNWILSSRQRWLINEI